MSTVKADNFTWKSGQSGGLTGTNVTGDQIVYGVSKAWGNFNGVTTVTTRATYNISSITRNTTADYTVSFSNSFNDANYTCCGSSCTATGGTYFVPNISAAGVESPSTVSSIRFETQIYNAYYDSKYIYFTINR